MELCLKTRSRTSHNSHRTLAGVSEWFVERHIAKSETPTYPFNPAGSECFASEPYMSALRAPSRHSRVA
jgi:hypothetical protein